MFTKNKILLFVLAVFGYCIPSFSQISVEVEMDTSRLLIGDHAKVTLKAIVPQNMQVEFPLFNDTIIGELEILDILPSDTNIKNNLQNLSQQYLVTSFDSGWFVIPEQKFVVNNGDWNDTLYSKPIYFGVFPMPLDTANANAIADIKAPIDAPVTLKEALPYAGGSFGFLTILFLAYLLYMRYAKKQPVFVKKEKPREPAHVIAFRDLDKLKEAKLWQQGKNKEYYSELTDIVRTYIEDRYGIQAMELTTDEIIGEVMAAKIIEKDLKDQLFDTLVRADFVKFAKATTLANENEASMKFAYEFVIKTKPVVVLTGKDKEQQNNDADNNQHNNESIE